MAAFPTGPMEVVFSFDTTGSMSQVLDEVRGRVSDIVQRLQADIPGFRVGIIAHGDYCDEEHFYVIKTLDLTNSLPDAVAFLQDTSGTGGGDVPECYELALRHACNFNWTPQSHRILVMIGDAYPHDPDYPLNTGKIAWQQELETLRQKDVKIYSVQVHNDEISTKFFKTLSEKTGGQHLKLANMHRICEVIMGVCYREKGAEFFENYEAEIRCKEPEKMSTDLEDLFGTLRREESRRSDATAILNEECEEERLCDVMAPCSGNPSRKRKASPDHQSETTDIKRPRKILKPVYDRKVKLSTGKATKANITGKRSRREHIPATHFKYRDLPWSQWKLAVSPPSQKTELSGEWKTVPQCGSDKVLWRRDLLDSCPVKSKRSDRSGLLFEISVMSPASRRRQVVSCHVSHAVRRCTPVGVFGLPWYRGVFRSVRKELNKAACDECKVYMRWARVTPKHRNIMRDIHTEYDYAWRHRTDSVRSDVF